MALAERADLVARLSLEGNFVQKAGQASRALKGMEDSFKKIAGHANQGLRNAVTNTAKIGIVAGGIVADQVRRGLGSLAELEDAVTSVDGAIRQVGKGWTITGAQIASIANEIETDVQRAFDDKEITAGAAALIRYGKVTQSNLRPALVVMTDLAAKTGSVESASSLLSKALAAPEKAAGKLARVGVILTKQQEKQIAAFVKAGKVGKAQKVLLDALAASTKGAAAASAGPYRDALNILADVTEDAQRVLAEAFLPILGRVANELSTFVADPENLEKIRDFGHELADGFESLLGFAKNIPWGTIGTSLQIGGAGAKAIFSAFTSLPPWVQTAVITGWGLNKLTGGALGAIVGELGKGLIRGVLGINAGVVNVRGGVVNGGGVGGAAGAGGGILGIAAKAFTAASVAFIVAEVLDQVAPDGVKENTANTIANALGSGKSDSGLRRSFGDAQKPVITAVDAARDKMEASRIALNNLRTTAQSQTSTLSGKLDATITAIRQSQPNIKVNVNVTANTVTNSITKNYTYSASHVGALSKSGALI